VLKDQIVYATADAIQIYDMHGNLARTVPLGYTLTSGVAGDKDMLFVAEAYPDGGRLAALDLNLLGGTTYDPSIHTINAIPKRWEYLVPGAGIVSTPVLLNDAVYVAAENGTIAALATSDREPLWPTDNGVFQCYGSVLADLVVDEYGVYAASYGGMLYCLNPNNGKVRWQYFAPSPLTTDPSATKDLVFEFVPGAGVVAIDKTAASTVDRTKRPTYDRTPRWTAGDCTQFLAEDNKYVYLLRKDHHICACDKDTGKEVFVSKRSDFIAAASNNNYGALVGSPADSSVYATLSNGTILSINAVTLPGIIGQVVLNDASDRGDRGTGADRIALASVPLAPRSAGVIYPETPHE
jgi:outer membrane protein assembly factor BamB